MRSGIHEAYQAMQKGGHTQQTDVPTSFCYGGSDYLTTNFLPFLIYTPFEASPVMRRPARSKIGAFVTSAPSTSGIPIAEGVSWKLNVRVLAVGEQYLLATLAALSRNKHLREKALAKAQRAQRQCTFKTLLIHAAWPRCTGGNSHPWR